MAEKEARDFRYALDESAIVTIADPEGRILYANDNFCRISQYSRQELIGQKHRIVNSGYHPESFFANLWATISDGKIWRGEVRNKAKEGSFFWMDTTIVPFLNGGDKPNRYIAIRHDITDRKKAEEEIIRSEEKYRGLIEQASDGIIVYTFDGRIHDFNPSAYLQTGYTREEFSKLTLGDLIPDGKIIINRANVEKLKAGETVLIYREIRCKNGTIMQAEISSRMLPDGRMLAMIRDNTERLAAEKALAESENHLRTIIEAEPECVHLLNKQCELGDMNRTGLEIIEADNLAQVKGKSVLGIIDELYRQAFINLTENVFKGKSGRLEFEITGLKGTKRWLETHAVPLKNVEGKIISQLSVTRDITDRKKAEQELQSSRKQFQSLVENISGVYWVNNMEPYQTLYISPSYETIWGRKCEDLYRNPADFIKAVHPEDKESLMEAFNSLTKTHSANITYRIIRSDGEIRWIDAKTNVVIDSNGNKTEYGYAEDITERKKAEEALIVSEKEFRSLAESMPQIVWATRPDGWNIYFNQQWVDYTGLTMEESYGHGWNKPFHPDDQQRAWDAWKNAVENIAEYSLECRLRRYDGSYRWWLIRGIPQMSESGEIVKWYGTCTDIEKIKETEDTIKQSEEKYKDLVDNITDLICTHDLDGKILSMNKAAEKLTGNKFNPKSQFNIKDILTSGSKNMFNSYITEIQKNGHAQNLMKVKLRDGQIRIWEFKNSLKTTGVKNPEIRGYARDITESKKAEEMLQKSYEDIRRLATHLEKVREEERTHMAREIHDELGQQLTVMKMDVSWLDEKLNKADKTVRQRTETLKAMLDKTVTTVRQLAHELRPSMLDDMGLGAALEWHLSEFEKRSGVKTKLLKPEKEPDLPDAIKTGLFRIVQESLTNVARYAQAKNVTVHMQPQEKELALIIKDDGIGFDKEKVAAKKTLGILGMQERTLIMGGTYEINSMPGKGTVVTVRVPLKYQSD